MSTIVPWLVVLALPLAALPWSLWLLARADRRPDLTLTLALSLALAYGALTLTLFWLSLLGLPLDALAATLILLGLALAGLAIWSRAGRPLPPRPRLDAWTLVALVLMAAVAAAILFNAAYWPFSRDDTLGIYHAQALQLVDTRALLPLTGADSLYLAYPPLMQLAYAYTYLLAGWPHEYLARFASALLALGGLLAAYALGRDVADRPTGLLAALLLALMPTFGRWASTGYVDLPSAFYVTLAAVFALRLWRAAHTVDALLAGVCIGLAAWTKNAALLEVAALGGWLVVGLVRRRFSLRAAIVAALGCAVVAAPWYVRNGLGAGFLVPDTAWTDQARPTLDTLLLFVTRPEIYGPSGWAILGGLVFCVVQFARRRNADSALLLLLWTLPFYAVWWLLTSYDPRLLLPVVPVFAVIGGSLLTALWRAAPLRQRAALRFVAAVLAVALAASAVYNSVEFKDDILRNPLMNNAAKHALVLAARE